MSYVSWAHDIVVGLITFLSGGAVVGFLGNEINRRVVIASEDRKQSGRALVELLEMRNYLAGFNFAKRTLEDVWGEALPAEIIPMLYAMISKVLPIDWVGVRERYNNAVSELAALRPSLAYKLRSKDILSPFLEQLGTAAVTDPGAAKALEMIDVIVSDYGLAELREAALALARQHGRSTLRDVRKDLKSQDSGKEKRGIEEMVAKLKELKAEQSRGAHA